jgi:hypothetical protein
VRRQQYLGSYCKTVAFIVENGFHYFGKNVTRVAAAVIGIWDMKANGNYCPGCT